MKSTTCIGCTQEFNPFQKLVVDESVVLFKGRLAFKHFISTKRSSFGIKLFVLYDCESDVVLDFIVYTVQGTPLISQGMTHYRSIGACGEDLGGPIPWKSSYTVHR